MEERERPKFRIVWCDKEEVDQHRDRYNTNNHYEVCPWGNPDSNPDFGRLYRNECTKYNFTQVLLFLYSLSSPLT